MYQLLTFYIKTLARFIYVLFKLFWSVEPSATCFAAVGFQFKMASFMIILVAIGGESLAAICAGKKLFSSMDSLMLQETGFVLENLTTWCKRALVGMLEYIKHFERLLVDRLFFLWLFYFERPEHGWIRCVGDIYVLLMWSSLHII